MVSPAFLLVMGISIPLAVERGIAASGTAGWYGAPRSLLFTAPVLILATVVIRCKFKLQV
jgi:uncharacterized membrane protein YdbT with pleckstrin-like domain